MVRAAVCSILPCALGIVGCTQDEEGGGGPKAEYFKMRQYGNDPGEGVVNPVLLTVYTAGLAYYPHPTVRLQLNGLVARLSRDTLPGQEMAPAFAYFEKNTLFAVVSQLQFWFQ